MTIRSGQTTKQKWIKRENGPWEWTLDRNPTDAEIRELAELRRRVEGRNVLGTSAYVSLGNGK